MVNSQQYVALDAPTGEQRWIHQRSGVCGWPGCPRHADGQLLLLEGKTGKAIWDEVGAGATTREYYTVATVA